MKHVLPALLMVALLAACGRDESRDAQAVDNDGDGVIDALPTPAGTPGGSVTGMPTAPPRSSADAVVVQEAPQPVPEVDGTLPPGADPNAVPIDPATGLAAGGTPGQLPDGGTAVDASPAANLMRDYAAALGAGAFAAAQQMWSTTPTDSALLQLARGQAFGVDVLPAAVSPAGVVTVPLRARGVGEDGTERTVTATYTLRRTAEGQWRIASATVSEAAP